MNHRLFQAFCKSDDSEYIKALFNHAQVRWLSYDQVIFRGKTDFSSSFDSPEFVQILAYWTDLFTQLNELNISTQRSDTNIVIAPEKLTSFNPFLFQPCDMPDEDPLIEEIIGIQYLM